MRRMFALVFIIIAVGCSFEFSYSADVRFGMARMVKERKKDLDKKVGGTDCNSVCKSTETILYSDYGGGAPEKYYVITDNNQLKNLWEMLMLSQPIPKVCFANCMLVAALGSLSDGCHLDFRITSAVETENKIEVTATTTITGCIVCTQIFKGSFVHIVKMRKSSKPVTFIEATNSLGCK